MNQSPMKKGKGILVIIPNQKKKQKIKKNLPTNFEVQAKV
jgi:hypothetical protein